MTQPLQNPPFVAIEGLDGAGTTTQARRVSDALVDRGQPVSTSCEPSNGPVGMLIRQMLSKRITVVDADGEHREIGRDTLALLFAADRLDHLQAEVEPALNRGQVAITDRYYHSSLVYQGTADADDVVVDTWVEMLNERARAPDLTVFLEATAELSLQRLQPRGSRDIYESKQRLELFDQRYRDVMDLVESRGERVLRLDAARPAEELTEAIVEEIWEIGSSG